MAYLLLISFNLRLVLPLTSFCHANATLLGSYWFSTNSFSGMRRITPRLPIAHTSRPVRSAANPVSCSRTKWLLSLPVSGSPRLNTSEKKSARSPAPTDRQSKAGQALKGQSASGETCKTKDETKHHLVWIDTQFEHRRCQFYIPMLFLSISQLPVPAQV